MCKTRATHWFARRVRKRLRSRWRKQIPGIPAIRPQSKPWHVNNVSNLSIATKSTSITTDSCFPAMRAFVISRRSFVQASGSNKLPSSIPVGHRSSDAAGLLISPRVQPRTIRLRHGISAPGHADVRNAIGNSSTLPRSFGGHHFETLRKLCGI
jgi:hypothetical protein